MRSLPVLLCVLLVLPTLAEAHITGSRPVLQRLQSERIVSIAPPEGFTVHGELSLVNDPLRQFVRHTVDPPGGRFYVEHRTDASDPGSAFFAGWTFDRLVEYRDLNVDGKYQPQHDTAVKAWRFNHYNWELGRPQHVQVGDITADSVVWEGNLTGAPQLRLEVVFAGKDFSDEGALVRPQDIAIYLDFLQMPPRTLGSLYALEGRATVQAATTVSRHVVDNTTTALLADAPLRRGLFVWGGEALIDGREQRVNATIEEGRVGDDGNKTVPFVLHLPIADQSMRFVMVSGVEYGIEDRRAPWPATVAMLAAAAAACLVGRMRRR